MYVNEQNFILDNTFKDKKLFNMINYFNVMILIYGL